ncbi:carbohydrate esterase family 16 protein [Mycena olivaceomarginata]|nr:carbohydrate esterase family 16 protein [Mycena olivaceomarginata]
MVSRTWTSIVTLVSVAAAVHLPVERQTNDGVHLAITPVCGKLGGTFANTNAGVPTTGIKTLVAFGDYTSGGRSDGGTSQLPFSMARAPALVVVVQMAPSGLRCCKRLGATIKDYAVSGAVVNVTLWPSEAGQTDFLHEAALFLSQKNVLDPATTLYTVFFGINDFVLLPLTETTSPKPPLSSSPDQTTAAAPPSRKTSSSRRLRPRRALRHRRRLEAGRLRRPNPARAQGLNVAFVTLRRCGTPCWGQPRLRGTDLSGECATPLNSFYWLPGHPSKETHRIMADYVKLVLANCKA